MIHFDEVELMMKCERIARAHPKHAIQAWYRGLPPRPREGQRRRLLASLMGALRRKLAAGFERLRTKTAAHSFTKRGRAL